MTVYYDVCELFCTLQNDNLSNENEKCQIEYVNCICVHAFSHPNYNTGRIICVCMSVYVCVTDFYRIDPGNKPCNYYSTEKIMPCYVIVANVNLVI